MTEQYYFPSKVSRSVKLMTKTFESENIHIEYTLQEVPPELQAGLIEKVNAKMKQFLDEEEKKIRDKYGEPDRTPKKSYSQKTQFDKKPNGTTSASTKRYDFEITPEGVEHLKSLDGEFNIVKESQGDFKNFIHLWFQHNTDKTQRTYIGHLHKIKGEFKFKEKNKEKIDQMKIDENVHFRIVDRSRTIES